jgi:hypothetical protein
MRALAFGAGAALVGWALSSAVRAFVLPRSAQDRISRAVFVGVRWFFSLFLQGLPTYAQKDRVLALYAPVSLLALTPTLLLIIDLGYTAMYWAIGVDLSMAFLASGSSLLTLGVQPVSGFPGALLMFSEAAVGMALIAVLIGYLPTMYAAFSKRETAVTLLAVRAGEPASAIEMIIRYHRVHGLEKLGELWATWEVWFAELEESHTSLPALNFFRSPQPEHSWVVAAGAVLDAAALAASTLDLPPDPRANLCIRAGFLALRHICDFFNIPYPRTPRPTDPITLHRVEFEAAYEELARAGVPLKADRAQAWRDFAGWRVNYDLPLVALCSITTAPWARWSADRAPQYRRPPLFFSTRQLPGIRRYESS